MENIIKVFIVDDHEKFRMGVKMLLNKSDHIQIIGEAVNGNDFLNQLNQINADVILMDISMPEMNGIDASKKAISLNPELKILVLSMFGDEEYYFKMIYAGVKGFVLKSSGINELEKAIKTVANNDFFFSAELLQNIASKIEIQNEPNADTFLEEEFEILKLIAKGCTNEEILAKMSITTAVFEVHKKNLLHKSRCNNTASLVMYAIRNKIIDFA